MFSLKVYKKTAQIEKATYGSGVFFDLVLFIYLLFFFSFSVLPGAINRSFTTPLESKDFLFCGRREFLSNILAEVRRNNTK